MSLGTWLFTMFNGTLVGTDDEGNRFYIERRRPKGRRRRRWVIYSGEKEASRIAPDWHAWLHYTVDETPLEKPLPHKAWEKEPVPNLTGTPDAYHPPGSDYEGGKRARGTGDYEPWRPA